MGLEKLLKSRGFAGQFVACQVRRDCFVKLGGAANALSGEQWERGLRIVLLQLALLPLLNHSRGFVS